MRDELPSKPRKNECGILNLQRSIDGNGTHWTAWYKRGANSTTFDSYGNLKPPKELISYLGNNITYNFDAFQNYDTVICGHLCLIFLYMCYNSTKKKANKFK